MGVLSKDETMYEDVIDILHHIQCYVPYKAVQRELKVPGSDKVLTLNEEFATTLVGGDQLTVTRA